MLKDVTLMDALIKVHQELPTLLRAGITSHSVLVNGKMREFSDQVALTEEISWLWDEIIDLARSKSLSNDEMKLVTPLYYYWYEEDFGAYINSLTEPERR